MFEYDVERFRVVIGELARRNLEESTWYWLETLFSNYSGLNLGFSQIPRKSGKAIIKVEEHELDELQRYRPGFAPNGWTADRLSRVCLLVNLNPSDEESYFHRIETLFSAADIGELVALYSSLPLLAWPESWGSRCAEGVRSNIGPVLESIMYENPFPSEQLDENAWNQLVLKAFFTDKDINRIYGIDDRANQKLALTLSDYAHERWAAGRSVNPLLWRLVPEFIDERILSDLQKILRDGTEPEKQAAFLTIRKSEDPRARILLEKNQAAGILFSEASWEQIALQF